MRVGVRPWWPLVGLTAALWAIWMATGFHFNGHGMTGFSISAELFNETAKTLWALAYLVPLLVQEQEGRPRPLGQGRKRRRRIGSGRYLLGARHTARGPRG